MHILALSDGTVVWAQSGTVVKNGESLPLTRAQAEAEATAAGATGTAADWLSYLEADAGIAEQIAHAGLENLEAVIDPETGEVASVDVLPTATAFIHCELSATKPDAGGGDPVESALFGLPAIRPNCAGGAADPTLEDVLTALISLRESEDPESAVLSTISGDFPITILPELGGGDARQLAVTVAAGLATVYYRALPGSSTGKYQLRQESLAPLPDGQGGTLMETKLVGDPVSFRIYEVAEQA